MDHTQVLERFLKAQRSAHHMSDATVRGYQWKLGALFTEWASTPMASWDYGMWEDYLADNEQWGARTIKKLTSHCSKFIKWCKSRKIAIGDFLEGYEAPKDVKSTPQVAKPEHVRVLMKEAKKKSPRLTVCIGLAAYCGLRRNEIAGPGGVTWKDVDLENKRIRVFAPKTKKERFVPLNALMVDLLREWKPERAKDTDPVVHYPCFGGTLGNGNRDLAKLQDWCGTPRMGWHSFRHHFGTELVRAGVDLATVRDLMGHGSLEMTNLYAHSSPKNMAEAVELLCT